MASSAERVLPIRSITCSTRFGAGILLGSQLPRPFISGEDISQGGIIFILMLVKDAFDPDRELVEGKLAFQELPDGLFIGSI